MTVSSIKRGWNFDKDTLADHLGWEELPSEEELYDHLLDIDIKEFGSPVLVDIPPSSTNIPKDVVLQVRRVKNVSVPESSWKSGTFESSKNDVLRYYLTDGHSSISACDMNGQFRLNRGTKVLFHKDCPIDCGFILMDKKYLTVYGGGIPDAIEQKAAKVGEDSAIARQAPKFAELLNPKKAAKVKMDYKLPSNSADNGNVPSGGSAQQEKKPNTFNENSASGGRNDRGTRQRDNFDKRQERSSADTFRQEEPARAEYGTSTRGGKQRDADKGGRQDSSFKRNERMNYSEPTQQREESNFGQNRQSETSYQNRKNERAQDSFGNYETRPNTVPSSNYTKGRGNFQYDSQAIPSQRMYDDYEHNVVSNLTFSKGSGPSQSGVSQQRDNSNRNFGKRETQPSQPDRNRHQQRSQEGNYSNFNRDGGQHSRNNDRGIGGRGSERSRGGRDTNRGRGRGGGRGRGDYNQGNTGTRFQQSNYSAPLAPQFNAASDFDFPTLGDAMTGMNLH